MYRARLTKESTPQEVFDHIKAAAKAGSFPSYNSETGKCFYRREDKACLFGIFIPDEVYDEEMDFNKGKYTSVNADNIMQKCGMEYPEFLLDICSFHVPMINRLQNVHDTYAHNKVPFDDAFISEIKEIFENYDYDVA